MPKVAQRLLIFFIGIPLVIAIIIPSFYNHLLFQILLFIFVILATIEMCNILSSDDVKLCKPLYIILNLFIVLTTYICGLLCISFELLNIILCIAISIVFCTEIFCSKNNFSTSNKKIASGIFTIIYTGFLPTYISKLTTLNNATKFICLFMMLVFISDSAAWLFGMLFGKNNRGVFAASPKKSIAGFIGAYLGALLVTILFCIFFLESDLTSSIIIKSLILSICVTTATIIGDLAESVFKRSCGFKDSGNIILGRGGVLDSIDSMLLASPIFYILVKSFFNF